MQNILTIIHVSLDKMEAGMVENVNGTATPGNTTPATQQRKPVKLKAGFSLLKYVLLSIVTLGIYGLYCFARMGDLLNQIAGRYAGRRTADSDYSELVGIGWYSAGTVCDRSGLLRRGAPDYYGTEYRYVCDSAHFRDRSKEKCEAYRICTSVF